MIVFGIRHKPSGRLMPAVKGRGSTALNFHRDGFENEFARHKLRREPRIFALRIGAQRALAAWLKGEWIEKTSRSGLFGEEYDTYSVPPAHPPADRKPEEMEIVQIILSVQK